MKEIKSVPFTEQGLKKISKYHFGKNWPVVYILENAKEAYIGETNSAYKRGKDHHKDIKRKDLKRMHVITDEKYNKSATLDIESLLIQYMSADGSMKLQNGNVGLKDRNYYDREVYRAKFEELWETLKQEKIVNKTLLDIRNSDIFKYSPYKALTVEQDIFVNGLLSDLKNKVGSTYVVDGSAGTGKTVLATYLIKRLVEDEQTKNMKIGLVIAMTALRSTLRKVFSSVKGLKASMVLGPNEVCKDQYDLLIVDEAHRLKKRLNLGASYGAFDNVNKKLGLSEKSTQLDWIMKSSKRQIFFYDTHQNVMPADIDDSDFEKLNSKKYTLRNQLRVQAGNTYISFIYSIFEPDIHNVCLFENYEFKVFDDVSEMQNAIKQKETKCGLSRIVAGYSWPWRTKKDKSIDYDIDINGHKMKWNSVTADWVNSKNAINEVGCIHMVQGYDLNYVGVIIGKELAYSPDQKKIIVKKEEYCDRYGYIGVRDEKELERYIINIYRTLLTRGIKGTFVYAVDKNLRNFIKNKLLNQKDKIMIDSFDAKEFEIIMSDSLEDIEKVEDNEYYPIFGAVNAGDAVNYTSEKVEGYLVLPLRDASKYKGEYFVVRIDGDSMNNKKLHDKTIEDGDYVLIEKTNIADIGDIILAISENETANIKELQKSNGKHLLRSVSKYSYPDIIDPFSINGKVIRVFKR